MNPMTQEVFPNPTSDLPARWESVRRWLVRFSILSLWLGMSAGLLSIVFYTTQYRLMHVLGLTLQTLRPIHLGAGTLWIYLAGLAVVVHEWSTRSQRRDGRSVGAVRLLLWTWVWAAALGVLLLLFGFYGGREYFFVATPVSLLALFGWVVFAIAYCRDRWEPLQGLPAYRWMWLTSLGLFVYAFVETHVFLLPYFQTHPLRDLAVEWKSYGTLVGSFNLLVYGALIYLGQQLNPASNYAHSRLAFGLFFVGVFNSFTNFGHHTYHLPQTELVKWTSFLVSMTEIIILAKVVSDTFGWSRRLQQHRKWDAITWLLCATSFWTLVNLVASIAISIPPLNSLIHGTLVVASHAMGSMLGIDTMGLLAVLLWMHQSDLRQSSAPPMPRWPVWLLNVGVALIWGSLTTVGLQDSFRRWDLGILPSRSMWPGWLGPTFAVGGCAVAVGIAWLTWQWLIPRRWLAMLQPPSAPVRVAGVTKDEV